ncbi:MAG: hypothetical protein B7Y99_00385 [Caulobacterales bacterium 32-69-10]|nr:MAG: hypothetical protein B7Y99_00385 [Caulobacterales bacterium 32-69-10]
MLVVMAVVAAALVASATRADAQAGAGAAGEMGAARLYRANLFAEDGVDPRRIVDRGLAPELGPVGMIETAQPITFNRRTGVVRGTAFLISPCYAISNRHLVFGDETDNLVAAENSMKIWLGFSPGGGFDAFTLATPVAWGRRTLAGTNDWAISRLKTCVGRRVGWMDIQPEAPLRLAGAWVATAGYPGDKPRGELWSHARCRIRFPDRRVGLLTHDCATVAGMSGSPIYKRLPDGSLKAVAMTVGNKNDSRRVMTIYGRNFANTAMDLAGVFADPQLKQMILDDIAAFGRENPSSSPEPQAAGGSATDARR